MATLTYDPTPADQPEFNEQEQEALAIGEQAAADQQQMLAGKFKDAESLEKAYLELQSKLGEQNANESDEVREQEEAPEEEVNESQELLQAAAAEWQENGQLSDETYQQLSQMSGEELLTAYLDAQSNVQESPDFTEQQVASIYEAAGGEESYNQIIGWAQDSLSPDVVQAYNNIVENGDPTSVRLALAGLQAAFMEGNGYEGEMLTGKASQQVADVFRSQAEVVQAMSDPRYDRDPAYRNDVFEKLNRSTIDY